jgi:Protein of unknown function VcgC/VcgE (DUF2780)
MENNVNLLFSLLAIALLTGCAAQQSTPPTQPDLMGSDQALQQGAQMLGGVQSQPPQTVGLTDLLTQRLGISQTQAQSGAGALFQMAKSQMQANAFAKLSQAVPGMGGLLSAAPALQQPSGLGRLSALAGGGSAGNMLGLASAFQQSGMSPSMIQQFIPVIIDYVKGTGGNGLAGSLGSAFLGL